MDVKRLVRPNVRTLRAYEAKEVPCRVKLDANESPYGYPFLKGIETNRYPDPEAVELKRALARELRLKQSAILVGNGSDEIIYYLITTFGGPVLYPTPTFVMYGLIARALGEKAVEAPLEGGFDLDLKGTLGAMRKHKPKLIFLSSPNNPTGNRFSPDRILRVIRAARGIVVIDEAYQPFSGGRGFLPHLKDFGNLLVMRTLSKVGLAALRVGFLIGNPEAIGEVNKVRLPFNLNSVSQALALEALKDKGAMKRAVGAVVSGRKKLQVEMAAVEGVEVYPSEANFLLFKVSNPGSVHAGLLERGVLIRDLGGIINGCLRVTVGTEKENGLFLKALKAVLKQRQSIRGGT
jgi:histidinol-phosphate aminotransferase